MVHENIKIRKPIVGIRHNIVLMVSRSNKSYYKINLRTNIRRFSILSTA